MLHAPAMFWAYLLDAYCYVSYYRLVQGYHSVMPQNFFPSTHFARLSIHGLLQATFTFPCLNPVNGMKNQRPASTCMNAAKRGVLCDLF